MSLSIELHVEPCPTCGHCDHSCWWNITHNLSEMASEAGVYKCLWRPDENGIKRAADMVSPLEDGLFDLKNRPEHFKQFNPDNGWGNYDGLVDFVEEVLDACRKYPDATVSAHR